MDSPNDDMQSLPEGLEALRALVLTTLAERDAAVTERDILLAQNDRLRHLLRQLGRMQFGPRSERLPEEQLQLGLEALEQAIAKENAEAEKRDRSTRPQKAFGPQQSDAGSLAISRAEVPHLVANLEQSPLRVKVPVREKSGT